MTSTDEDLHAVGLGEGGSMSIGDPITATTYDGNRAKWDPYRSNK